jgi:hypothetical protein
VFSFLITVFPGHGVTPPARRTRFIRLIGRLSLFGSRNTLAATSLNSGPGFQHILVNNDCEMADHVLIELEGALELRYDVRRRFVKHLHVEPGVLFPDGVRKAPSPPTIDRGHFAAVLRYEFLVARDNGLNLTVFKIGVDDKCCLVLSLNDVQFNSPPLVNLAVRR